MKSSRCATRQAYRLTALVLFGVFVFSIQPSRAQSQDSQAQETQQLKRTLSQLEQTIGDLKARINALESKQALDSEVASLKAVAPPSSNVKPSSGVMPLITVSKPAAKQEPQEDPAKQTMEHEIKPAPEGTFQMYGFAMLDAGYDFGQINPDWYDVVRPTKLPAFNNEFGPSGNVFFSVRQTRWGVKTSVPTGIGDLKTIFEFELFGTGVDAGQTTFRLRHAWGELRQIGAGQTWSPFMDPDVFPNSIEYWGPTGMVFFLGP